MFRLFCALWLARFPLCGAFFVPVATSSSVTRVARSIELGDSTLIVARNSTRHPIGFHDFCPHRGASFNNVPLDQDSVSCPYHGFVFDTRRDGDLTSGLGVEPGCSSLKMVDCVDSHGLVWMCVDGNTEVGPPPELAQASDPTFRKLSGSVTIQCPAERLVENVLDFSHTYVVHSFGNRMDPEPISYKAQKVSETHGSASFECTAGGTSMFNGGLHVDNWYHTPCTAGTLVRSGDNVKVVRVHAVQLHGGLTRVFWELYRNWATHPLMDAVFDTAMKITLDEDKQILESCSFVSCDKFSGKFDKLQLLYRKSLKAQHSHERREEKH